MKIILAVLILGSIVIETTLFFLPLTLVAIVTVAPYFDKKAKLVAFAAGLLLDIFAMRLLGVDSLFFLGLLTISERYQKKFHADRLFYKIAFLILAVIGYSLLFYHPLNFVNEVVVVTVGVIFMLVARHILPEAKVNSRLTV